MRLLRFLLWFCKDTWRRFRAEDRIRSRFAGRLTTAPGVRVFSPHRLVVAEGVHLDHGAYLHCGDAAWCRDMGGIRIGAGSYVGPHCTLFGMGSIEIGNGVLISPGCVITSLQHPHGDTSVPIGEQPRILEKVVIEDDVYLGSNVVVTPGVHIGRGAVVGAGAVVTRDIEPFAIALGVPARVVDSRKSGTFGVGQKQSADQHDHARTASTSSEAR
ncbi:MAG: acyltransferase [Planctomycetota bacterium]